MHFGRLLLLLALSTTVLQAGTEDLQPILTQPDQPVLEMDFSSPAPLDKSQWTPRQATRWAVEDGVLRGRESSPENQAKKTHHRGLEPRISAPVTPPEFLARLSVRFLEGEETTVVPFIEFGHHILRLRFSAENGIELLVDYESTRLAHAPDFAYEPGVWYHLLAELVGEEFVVQFADGPTLYATHPVLARSAPSGGTGLGLAGPRGGVAELDNVSLWTVKPGPRAGWKERRAAFPAYAPVVVKAKKEKVAKP